MQLSRLFGLTDLAVVVVVLFVFGMPPREMAASPVVASTETQFSVALAEARTLVAPDDPARAEELAQRLGEVGLKDWAIEAGIDGARRAKDSPVRWRALLAASVAYIDQLDAKEALEYARRAFTACEAAGPAACPDFEKTRIEIYREHLDAGVSGGIDPRNGPAAAAAFRAAGEGRIRAIRIHR
jgi:hypothetical protein